MKLDQNRAPLWEAVRQHQSRQSYPFHVPGHKGGRGLPSEFREILPQLDLTEVAGLDNLLSPRGVIAEAEVLAAEWVGAKTTHFTTNGSSAALIAAVLACCPRGSRMALPQNAHLSLFHACVLGDISPCFISVEFDKQLGIPLGPTPEGLWRLLATERVALVAVVHPTYHGVCLDIAALAAVCRQFGVPLLVDEAHGTHLLLAEEPPFSAVRQGADIVVQSVHKTGLALTGAAWVHCLTEKWSARVKESLRLMQSTSPSYLLLTSLDLARARMAEGGSKLYQEAIEVAKVARALWPCYSPPRPYRQDPLRLVIDATRFGLSGYALARHFAARNAVPEMAEPLALTLVFGLYDREEALLNLRGALLGLTANCEAGTLRPEPLPWPHCPQVVSPREAYWQHKVEVPLLQARGRIAGDSIVPYPPGIPIIWPGQVITGDCVEYLLALRVEHQDTDKCSMIEKVRVLASDEDV
ncbi:MAG: Arginine decarboxylase [Firmicutes bacterium]|nr:Arginine decarboxylase [Bacillota bacterium]